MTEHLHGRAEDHHSRIDGTEDPHGGAEDHLSKTIDHHGGAGRAGDHHGVVGGSIETGDYHD